MKKFFLFAAPLVLALGMLASGGTSVFAAGPPGSPPGQEPCSHGNSGKDCRSDPSTNGEDCDAHGNNDVGGKNEDHCLGETPTTPTAPPETTTSSPPAGSTPETTTSSAPAGSTPETPSTSMTPTASGNAAPPGTSTPAAPVSDAPTGDVAGVQVTRKAQPKQQVEATQHAKPKVGSVLAAATTVKVPSALPFTP